MGALPPEPFKQDDAGGYRDIQRGDCAGHRYAYQEVAMLLNAFVQSFAFRSEDEDGWRCVFDLIVRLGPTFMKAVYPKTCFLQLLQSPAHVGNADDRQVFEGACRCAIHRLSKRRSPPLRNDHGISPRRVGCTNDGAQIMRVFHAIEYNEQASTTLDVFEPRVLMGRAEGDHTLVRNALCRPIEGFASLKTDRNRPFPAQIYDLLNTRAGRSLCNHNLVEWPIGPERLSYRMEA